MSAIRSILVPLDGSPPSLAALEHAIALAEDGGASIEVLHVTTSEDFGVGSQSPLTRGERREVDREMDDAIERARQELGGRVSRRTETGDPLRKIVEVAADGDYDLIVIGTHGRIGRLHSLLGSVAEGVVRNASCPVLTVRALGADYQSFAERRHGRPSLAEQAEQAEHPSR